MFNRFFLRRVAALTAALALLTPLLLVGCDTQNNEEEQLASETPFAADARVPDGHVVVANRASGTISVIDARNETVAATIPLPQAEDEPLPEPMYVVFDATSDRVFVGDRANSRVVAFDARTFAVEGTVPAGGIFHMWADPRGRQLWVTDDVNLAMTVIDPQTLTVLTTIPVTGGTPHDVFVDNRAHFAYVTLFVTDGADQVIQFSAESFAELARTDVGEDPHVSLTAGNRWLYVPCQNSNAVYVLDRASLAQHTILDVPGAHGAGMRSDGKFFYTTNLTGGGTDGLFAIDTRTNRVVGSLDTPPGNPIATPHNIALNPSGRKLFVTHSGATAHQVSIYTLAEPTLELGASAVVEVGLNPFGLAYVP